MTSMTQPELDASQGAWAVASAREVVETVVEHGSPPALPDTVDRVFEIDRGVFVTLRKNGDLRGCIGRPTPDQPAIEAIRGAAVDAATNDPRFPAVTPDELGSITVEVSVLTPPEPLDPVEPEAVTVGEDGLIVQRGGQTGLLLPQVPVDQGWDSKRFLAETCRKAGLGPDCWARSDSTFQVFQAQVFEETEPNGPVEQVRLSDEGEP